MLAEADVKHDKVLKEKNAIIQLKDEEISDLKSKMDDMSEEFGEMLRVRQFLKYRLSCTIVFCCQ